MYTKVQLTAILDDDLGEARYMEFNHNLCQLLSINKLRKELREESECINVDTVLKVQSRRT